MALSDEIFIVWFFVEFFDFRQCEQKIIWVEFLMCLGVKKIIYFTTFTTITTRRKTLPLRLLPHHCVLTHTASTPVLPPDAATTAISTCQGGFEVMAAAI